MIHAAALTGGGFSVGVNYAWKVYNVRFVSP